MNRRKPIKKNYFSIFSKFPRRWLVLSGIIIVVVIALIWIFQLASNSNELDGSTMSMAMEDIVAVFAIIGIPLACLLAVMVAFKKLTGISMISGVDWVGKITLEFIDWCIVNIQKSLGLKVKKTNHRVKIKKTHEISAKKKTSATKIKTDIFSLERIKAVLPKAILFKETLKKTPAVNESEPVFSGFQTDEKKNNEIGFDISSTEVDSPKQQHDVDFYDESVAATIKKDAVLASAISKPVQANNEEPIVTEHIEEIQAKPLISAKNIPVDVELEPTFDEYEIEQRPVYQQQEPMAGNEPKEESSARLDEIDTEAVSSLQVTDEGVDVELLQHERVTKSEELEAVEHHTIIPTEKSEAVAERIIETDSSDSSPVMKQEAEAEIPSDSIQNESEFIFDAAQGLKDNNPALTESSDVAIEIISETENSDFSQALSAEIVEETTAPISISNMQNEPDFILNGLQALKDNPIDSTEAGEADLGKIIEAASDDFSQALHEEIGVETSFSDSVQQQAAQMVSTQPDEINSAPINHIQPNKEITEVANPFASSAMFNQAEQTATNIIASFSEKFSRSFGGQQNKPGDQLPTIELLEHHQQSALAYSAEELDTMSRTVERVLNDYKVSAEVVGALPGPIITRFELSLAPGVKVSRVSGLAKDLARAMLVTSVRVVEIIEGTPYIGLEIPNQERELVSFREIISSEQFQQAKSPLTLALGKDVGGQTVVSDLAKMPHLLVAGTTGSGKSVAINTMIISLLYKATPDQVRMIMVDPKMLELSVYEGIPHLLTPVVTDMKEAQNALRWAVAEMERRYKLMSKVGVRNLAGYNQKIEDAAARGETIRDPLFQIIDPLEDGETFPVLSTLPSIVIVIDELADMMMIVGKKVEELIARLAQKARAAGIHLILATQRPSVDVLTGLIKANVPTRISFQVSSRIDSRTILDQGGAEALLGNGDMLFLPSGTSVPTRSHGAFVSDDEVHAVVNYLKSLGGSNYISAITQEEPTEKNTTTENVQEEDDALYNDAVEFVMETGRASISGVQRRFKIGYNRAARMIDQMEEENIVSEPEGNGARRILDRE